jgi:hypothetical protein
MRRAPGNRIRHPPLKLRDNFRRSNSCPHLRPHLRARIAQSPERAIRRPTRTHHLRCRPSDRPEVVAPLAQWPPSAARISPGEQLTRREGFSRSSAKCAANAENYETGRRHSGLMELLGRICGGRRRMVRVFRCAAVLLLLSWPASAEVHLDYTFSQWEKLQDVDRTAYIARFIDTLRTMAATEPAQLAARHYSQCIMRSRLTAMQLANFLREYVRARPEMQGSSVQHAIDDYLNALCGRPFD